MLNVLNVVLVVALATTIRTASAQQNSIHVSSKGSTQVIKKGNKQIILLQEIKVQSAKGSVFEEKPLWQVDSEESAIGLQQRQIINKRNNKVQENLGSAGRNQGKHRKESASNVEFGSLGINDLRAGANDPTDFFPRL